MHHGFVQPAFVLRAEPPHPGAVRVDVPRRGQLKDCGPSKHLTVGLVYVGPGPKGSSRVYHTCKSSGSFYSVCALGLELTNGCRVVDPVRL